METVTLFQLYDLAICHGLADYVFTSSQKIKIEIIRDKRIDWDNLDCFEFTIDPL